MGQGMMKKDIKILVAMHKKYWVARDPVYLPIFVGKRGRKSDWQCVGDDTGDNISDKNPFSIDTILPCIMKQMLL